MQLGVVLKSWCGNVMVFSMSSSFAEPCKWELLNISCCSLFWKQIFPLCQPQSVSNFIRIFPSFFNCLKCHSQLGCLVFALVCKQPTLCIFLLIQSIRICRRFWLENMQVPWHSSAVVLRVGSLPSYVYQSSLIAWQTLGKSCPAKGPELQGIDEFIVFSKYENPSQVLREGMASAITLSLLCQLEVVKSQWL